MQSNSDMNASFGIALVQTALEGSLTRTNISARTCVHLGGYFVVLCAMMLKDSFSACFCYVEASVFSEMLKTEIRLVSIWILELLTTFISISFCVH